MSQPLSQLGRYRVTEEIGRGAMGVVYTAEDPVLQRTVAVKTMLIPGDAEARAEYEGRFFQEAKAAAALNHPNIITVYDAGREGDTVYMAMELLEGTDVRALLKNGPLPLDLALDIATQVADALAVAHAQGVIHRDIKPANIMVVRERHAKIMDFGIARMRLSDVKTATGAVMGSPKYMSPEQVSGLRADHRSDIFSFGATFYEMLTGRTPFSGEDIAQLMYHISVTPVEPPSSLNPILPTAIDLIIAKALEKSPDARYQNAAALAADLRQFREQRQSPHEGPSSGRTLAVDVSLEATAAEPAPTTQGSTSARTVKIAPSVGAGPVPTFQLSLSRRFAADSALKRFDAPRGDFLQSSMRRLQRVRRDPYTRDVAIVIGAAVIAALFIAFV